MGNTTAEHVRLRVCDVIVDDRRNSRREAQTEAELAELATDIRQNGLIQSPVVRLIDDGHLLVVGYRRMAALRLIDEEMVIEFRVLETSDDPEQAELEAWKVNFSENLRRKGIKPFEIAETIYDIHKARPDLSMTQIAELTGLSRTYCYKLFNIRDRAVPELWALFCRYGKKYPHGITINDVDAIVRYPRHEQVDRWTALLSERMGSGGSPKKSRRKLKTKEQLHKYLARVDELGGSADYRAGVRWCLQLVLGEQSWPTAQQRQALLKEKAS